MRKLIAFVVIAACLGLLGVSAAAPRLLTRGFDGATALMVAGGLSTIALAARLRD
jgi:hypothetical protein